MKKRLMKFYRAHVGDDDDLKLFVGAVAVLAAAGAVLVYDVVTIVRGTVDLNAHLPFVLAAGLAGFGLIMLKILRHGVGIGRHP